MLIAVGRVGVRATGHVRAAPASPAAARPRPKEPEVLLTTATTGAGIPELLAALDRHRARARQGADVTARVARAEAQLWAILGERVRDRLTAGPARTATEATILEVAEHRLDPFAAADQLLAQLR
jgi:LAO/AO transport system kinase